MSAFHIISRPRYTWSVPSYKLINLSRGPWMKLNWLFWILKCVFLPLPGRRLWRMDDPRSDSPHREECTSLVILSLLPIVLVCFGYSSVYSFHFRARTLWRMYDPRFDSPHREECTLLVTLSFLKLAQRRRGEVHEVSFTGGISNSVWSQVFCSHFYFVTHSILIYRSWYKRRNYMKPSKGCMKDGSF